MLANRQEIMWCWVPILIVPLRLSSRNCLGCRKVSVGMLFREFVSMLLHCLPYALLFVLHEGVIYDVVNVAPCEGTGPSETEEFLMIFCRII
jgi:hypothetical protein